MMAALRTPEVFKICQSGEKKCDFMRRSLAGACDTCHTEKSLFRAFNNGITDNLNYLTGN